MTITTEENIRKKQERNNFLKILQQLYIDRLLERVKGGLCTFLFPFFSFLFITYLCNTDFKFWGN